MKSLQAVIDSNIFFRTLIARGDILKLLFNTILKIFAPSKLKEEFSNNKEGVLSKSKLSEDKFDKLSSLILKRITFITLDIFVPPLT